MGLPAAVADQHMGMRLMSRCSVSVPDLPLLAPLCLLCMAKEGRWPSRMHSAVITARRPLARDEDQLDYEVDSEDEWEEEPSEAENLEVKASP